MAEFDPERAFVIEPYMSAFRPKRKYKGGRYAAELYLDATFATRWLYQPLRDVVRQDLVFPADHSGKPASRSASPISSAEPPDASL